jgi:hypothetical protein
VRWRIKLGIRMYFGSGFNSFNLTFATSPGGCLRRSLRISLGALWGGVRAIKRNKVIAKFVTKLDGERSSASNADGLSL